MDISNLGSKKFIFFILLLILIRCGDPNSNEISNNYKIKSQSVVGVKNYLELARKMNDSLNNWTHNHLNNSEAENIYPFKMDSLICINNYRNRLIGCRHLYINLPDATSDDLQLFYGIKIDSIWYFFKGQSIAIPRKMVKGKDVSEPLTYQELHQIALKEVYNGYLDAKGEINENFFSSFEMDPYNMPAPDKETLEYRYISFSKGIWADKYAPYKKEDINFEYDPKTKEAKVSFQLQTFDSVYLPPVGYKIIYKRADMNYVDNACGAAWCEIDWKKNRIASGIIPKVEPGTDVEIYIEEDLYYDHRTKRLGPFVFKAAPKKRNEFIP